MKQSFGHIPIRIVQRCRNTVFINYSIVTHHYPNSRTHAVLRYHYMAYLHAVSAKPRHKVKDPHTTYRTCLRRHLYDTATAEHFLIWSTVFKNLGNTVARLHAKLLLYFTETRSFEPASLVVIRITPKAARAP